MRENRIEPEPGQESVWDYPRPPRVERSSRRVVVRFAGRIVAETQRAMRVLETSHPPVWYVPREDVDMSMLRPRPGTTYCEFKGDAVYFDLVLGDRRSESACWSYPRPEQGFEMLKDAIAFYPGRVDEASVDGEIVEPQPGGFYGGWITKDVVGPFKGSRGTEWW